IRCPAGIGLVIALALVYQLIGSGGDDDRRRWATASAAALAEITTSQENAAATAMISATAQAAANQTAAILATGTAAAESQTAAAAATGTTAASTAESATAAAMATRTAVAMAAATGTATAAVLQTAVQATANAERTAAANATASAVATAVAAAEAQAELAFGPTDGGLPHDTSDATVKTAYAPGELVGNLIVEARFFNPYDGTESGWDYGFFFRETDEHLYRVYVDSSETWSLDLWTSADSLATIATGPIPTLNTTANRSNLVRLVARGDEGWLFVNDVFVATLDLSAIDGGGAVGIGTGFEAGSERDGAETRYEGWAIWNLQTPAARTATAAAVAATTRALTATASAIAGAIAEAEAKADLSYGPDADSLRHEPNDNAIEVKIAPGTFAADVIVEARFFNPYDAEEHPWDYGFLFRDTEAAEYRLYIDSTARWRLDIWKAADGTISTLYEGEVAGVALEAGNSNHLRLVARGDRGWFLVNGNLAATLDLSDISTGGLVEVGMGFRAGDERQGAETRFEEWSVWSVIEPAARTATAVSVSATANAATATASTVAAEIAELTANAERAFGPTDGSMTGIQLSPGSLPAGMIVEVRLFNPAVDEAPNWNYGVVFRFANGSQYSLTVNVTGIWALLLTSMTETSAVVASGRVENADLDAGGSNLLRIVTEGDRGWLLLNDEFVTSLDLSAIPSGGQVGLVGFSANGPTTIQYQDYSIWKVIDPAQGTATAAAAASTSAVASNASAAATAIAETESLATLAHGPKSGVLPHVETDNSVALEYATVSFSPDLIAEARFFNPYDVAEHPWDYGFLFRYDGVRNYRLYFDSLGRWNLDLWTGTGATPVASGEASGADLSAGGSNVLRIVVRGEQGWLLINGDYVASLDLSAVPTGNKLAIGAGYRIGDEREGAETRYEDWSVWNVLDAAARTATAAAAATTTAEAAAMATTAAEADATAVAQAQRFWGPRDGSIAHRPENGQIDYWAVPVPVPTDFIAETRFFSPYDAAAHPWDFALYFRGGSSGPFAIVVDSSRRWELLLGQTTGWQSLDYGEMPSLDTSPLGSNVIRLVARGNEGLFFVNGTFVTRLDLSAIAAGHGLGVGLDFLPGKSQTGAVTRFQDLTVWAIVEPVDATATVTAQQRAQGTAYAVATEVATRGTVVAGPDAGTLTHDPAAIKIAQTWANVGVQNFIVEARFFNPYDRFVNAWDYGFGFRETALNQQ
ncbi:MAG: eukaryotic-like serine/threonine-protein kinase, partial [Thermomicrobiales bacterium]|nr:eukaryotic-like serine/threonine-protein kinase [Thermomicrobiales bacterium]